MRLVAPLAATLVVLAGGVPRILLASGALPDPLRGFVWSDPLFTYLRGLSGHRLPYRDTPFEYPPLLGALSGALSLISDSPTAYVVWWTVVLAAAAGACAYLLARVAGERRAVGYWSLAPQLLLLSTVNFDVIPTTLLTLAAVAQRSGRELAASGALAAGTAAKLFPLASVPLALARDRGRVAATACFVTVAGVFYLASVFQPYSSASGLAFYATGIGSNLDSVWGLFERALKVAGLPASSLAVLALTTGGLAVTYVVQVFPRGLRAKDPVVSFALATVVLLFWSRLYSPQFSLWLLPFYALVPLPRRDFALLTAADVGVFLTVYPLTLVPRTPDDAASVGLLGALAAFVLLRHVAIVLTWRDLLPLAGSARERSPIPDLSPRLPRRRA